MFNVNGGNRLAQVMLYDGSAMPDRTFPGEFTAVALHAYDLAGVDSLYIMFWQRRCDDAPALSNERSNFAVTRIRIEYAKSVLLFFFGQVLNVERSDMQKESIREILIATGALHVDQPAVVDVNIEA